MWHSMGMPMNHMITKTTKKQIIVLTTTFFLLLGMFLPVGVRARSSVLASVCPRIDSVRSALEAKVKIISDTVTKKKELRMQSFLEKRKNQEESLQTARNISDQKIAALIASYQKKATKDELVALGGMEKALEKIRIERQEAIDAVLTQSRESLSAALSDRNHAIEFARKKLELKAETVFNEVKNDCLVGKFDIVEGAEIISQMQKAHAAFMDSLVPTVFQATLKKIDANKKEKLDQIETTYQLRFEQEIQHFLSVKE